MGKHPKFDELEHFFDGKSEVILTEGEYGRITGASLPKERKYLMNQSAFSKWLQEKGCTIVDISEPAVERTVYIKKICGNNDKKNR